MEARIQGVLIGMAVASVVWVIGFKACEYRLHTDAINAKVARYNPTTSNFEYIPKSEIK